MIQVYHNKRCSKSNQAVNYLIEKGISADEVEIILYLDNPISTETASSLVDMLAAQLDDLIRKPDAKKLGIDVPKQLTKEWVIKAIVDEPKIMQRPIIVRNGKAVIGRPTELIDELL